MLSATYFILVHDISTKRILPVTESENRAIFFLPDIPDGRACSFDIKEFREFVKCHVMSFSWTSKKKADHLSIKNDS
jgi:hypothetical protein